MSEPRHLPRGLLAAACLGLAFSLVPPRGESPALRAFGELPALHNGRVKPLDTVARSTLLMLRGKQTVPLGGHEAGALEFLLEAATRSERTDAAKLFRIDDPDVLDAAGLDPSRGKYFSLTDLSPRLRELEAQAARAEAVEASARTRFQGAVLNLWERLVIYQRLKNTLQPEGAIDFPALIERYRASIVPGLAALAAHARASGGDRGALKEMGGFFEQFRFMADAAYFMPLPPPGGGPSAGWSSVGGSLLEALRGAPVDPGVLDYAAMLKARQSLDESAFPAAVGARAGALEARAPKAAAWARYEALVNRAEPFYKGMLLYALAFMLAAASWAAWPRALRGGSMALLGLAFALHTFGLVSRMLIEGRPPVTNLYSSAVYVGWAGVLVAGLIERRTRQGFGAAVAGVIGFATLIIAHHLADSGDTMEVMRAVLDSNFWLATHVVAITTGYSGTFLAGLLAHVYILRGALTSGLDRDSARALARTTYGVICFSLFFSFVGTVLGGIWADQSWGRFWGWDPKENGALLIVLWNAIILHLRWAGRIRERGLMVLAVLGNIVTSLSWFGVNMLGIGLHSYGFMDKAFYALTAFISTQIVVALLGGLPKEQWLSASNLPA